MGFDFNLILSSLPLLAAGLGVTLKLLGLASLGGLLLAFILLLMRLSDSLPLVWLAKAYIYFFRGTPILVQIFLIYYGLSQFESVRASLFWPILRQPFFCCALALSLNSAAYISEIVRGEAFQAGLLEGADHHRVHHARDDAGGVLDGFGAAQLRIAGSQVND